MAVEIELTKGYVTLVDEEDLETLAPYKWIAIVSGSGCPYAGRSLYRDGHPGRNLLLHRYLLDAPAGLEVDHINRDTLDNRRSNLRLATKSQNAANRPKTSGNFKGVNWKKEPRRWRAYIKVNDRHKHLGYFDTEEEAARVYDLAAVEAFGEFAFLNFPEEARS